MTVCTAQGEETKATGQPSVEAKIIVPKEEYVLGEEIKAMLVAVNTGKKKVKVSLDEPFVGTGGPANFVVEHVDGEPVGYLLRELTLWGENWKELAPGETLTLGVSVVCHYNIELPGEYRIRSFVDVARPSQGKARVYSEWHTFKVTEGQPVFRKDIEFARRRDRRMVKGVASVFVLEVAKVRTAYYKTVTTIDGKREETIFKRIRHGLETVDPTHKPQVFAGEDGWIHMLFRERPYSPEEARNRFKSRPDLLKQKTEYDTFWWHWFFAPDADLSRGMVLLVRKEDNRDVRLVKNVRGEYEAHVFTAAGKDLGAYVKGGKGSKEVRSNSSKPTSAPAN